jgi:hypothetical protein
MGVSRRSYAAQRGVSEAAVRKAIATGRIAKLPWRWLPHPQRRSSGASRRASHSLPGIAAPCDRAPWPHGRSDATWHTPRSQQRAAPDPQATAPAAPGYRPVEDSDAIRPDAANLKTVLGKVDRQYSNLRHGCLPHLGSYKTTLAHSMPSGRGIHRISSICSIISHIVSVFSLPLTFYTDERLPVRNNDLKPYIGIIRKSA